MKNYSFWIAVASSIMIFLQTLGTKIDLPYIDSVFNAFLGIFVVLGFIDKPKSGIDNLKAFNLLDKKDEENEDTDSQENDNSDSDLTEK